MSALSEETKGNGVKSDGAKSDGTKGEFSFLYEFKADNSVSSPTHGKHRVASIPVGIDPDKFSYICSAAYTSYTSNGRLPTPGMIHKLTGLSDKLIKRVIKSDEYLDAIGRLGVPINNPEGLTALQLLTLQVVSNPTDKRNLRAKLQGIGVTYPEYRAWMKQPAFANHLNETSEGLLLDHLPDFLNVLTQKAMGGDLNAIKYANELSGRHDPNKQQVLQLQTVVQGLLEIILKNVKDPETLGRIREEFQIVMAANNLVPQGTGTVRRQINGPNT